MSLLKWVQVIPVHQKGAVAVPVTSPSPTRKVESNVIEVFTDGGCTSNGRKGSRGGLGVHFPQFPELDLSESLPAYPAPTNNRAELLAVVRSLQQCAILDPVFEQKVVIKSDSQLACKTVNCWLRTWKNQKWLKQDGRPPVNLDILKCLDQLLLRRKVMMIHVKAHTGRKDFDSVHNDIADRLASRAIRNVSI